VKPRCGDVLVALADPEREAVAVTAAQAVEVIEAARAHGVLPIVLRKVGALLPEAMRAELQKEAAERIGLMLHLRAIGAKVAERVAGGMPAIVVKGPDLADNVYPVRGDRTFSDLDVLALPEAYPALAELMGELGYRLYLRPRLDHTESNQEQKWIHPGIPSVLVEVHGNLVHYAALRQRVSFGYPEVMRCGERSLALARFFTCVFHATLGHKLHELRLLVDILQTFRRLDADDRAALPTMARELGISLETALCLRLAGELFALDTAAEMALQIESQPSLYARLIDGASVLDFPHSRLAVARHHLARAYQYLVPRR
jgi:hypothetical protein